MDKIKIRDKKLSDKELCNHYNCNYKLCENSVEKDIQAAENDQLWDPESFSYGLCLGDGYINPYGVLSIQHGLAQNFFLFWK